MQRGLKEDVKHVQLFRPLESLAIPAPVGVLACITSLFMGHQQKLIQK